MAACSLDDRELDVVDTGLLPPDAGGPPGGNSTCGDGDCSSVECTAGTSECLSVTRVRRCTELGAWSPPAECEHACVGNACGGSCKPAQTRCASETTVETCTAEGEWGAPTACSAACSGDACLDECQPGDARCASPTQAQTCNELGQWLAPVSCPNVCTGSGCGGECSPNDGRCNAVTGLPQLCSAEGAWQDLDACQTGQVCALSEGSASCVCRDGLDACTGGCFDLDSDSNHCGACGHSCQGQPCNAGRCEPVTLVSGQAVTYRMALSDRELFFINAERGLNRVSKQGGAIQAIAVATELRGVGVDGDAVFWAQLPGPELDTFQIWRLDANGAAEPFAESPASDVGMGIGVISIRSLYLAVGTDALRVQDGFVYWSRDGYRRAPTTAAPLAAGELLGAVAMHGMLAPAEDCIYSADFASLHRMCTGAREAIVHSGNVILDVVTDADGVFFSEVGVGLRHLSLGSDSPNLTTLAPSSYALLGLATDESSVYFIDGAADPSTVGICVPGQGSIRRVSKDGGEASPLVEGVSGCPRFIAADDAFVYWAAWDGTSPTSGYVARIAK